MQALSTARWRARATTSGRRDAQASLMKAVAGSEDAGAWTRSTGNRSRVDLVQH